MRVKESECNNELEDLVQGHTTVEGKGRLAILGILFNRDRKH